MTELVFLLAMAAFVATGVGVRIAIERMRPYIPLPRPRGA
jgi:hypothetical protein